MNFQEQDSCNDDMDPSTKPLETSSSPLRTPRSLPRGPLGGNTEAELMSQITELSLRPAQSPLLMDSSPEPASPPKPLQPFPDGTLDAAPTSTPQDLGPEGAVSAPQTCAFGTELQTGPKPGPDLERSRDLQQLLAPSLDLDDRLPIRIRVRASDRSSGSRQPFQPHFRGSALPPSLPIRKPRYHPKVLAPTSAPQDLGPEGAVSAPQTCAFGTELQTGPKPGPDLERSRDLQQLLAPSLDLDDRLPIRIRVRASDRSSGSRQPFQPHFRGSALPPSLPIRKPRYHPKVLAPTSAPQDLGPEGAVSGRQPRAFGSEPQTGPKPGPDPERSRDLQQLLAPSLDPDGRLPIRIRVRASDRSSGSRQRFQPHFRGSALSPSLLIRKPRYQPKVLGIRND